jgi:DNA (cytosine-5)-methyltransferase 1
MDKTVIELFAGVGGFRVGLNHITKIGKNGEAVEKGPWKFVWANQWEPSTKVQHAFECYSLRFGEKNSSNEDITLVDKNKIPNHTLLTGGFPCQDYSVARSLKNEKGIEGKKGVLWWQINSILNAKKPKFVLLENVDRLLKAPARQRGQAFGVILRCFSDAGYGVQWRVINASEFGHPQKRRRVFIFAFHKSTNYYKKFELLNDSMSTDEMIYKNLIFSNLFKSKSKNGEKITNCSLSKNEFKDLVDISSNFSCDFKNIGYCLDYNVSTLQVITSNIVKSKTLFQCLDEDNVDECCYNVDIEKFRYLKGSKKISRVAKDGHKYIYSEGKIPFPDKLDIAGRTMLTSEGTTNRSSHLILDPITNRYRILTPVECERLDEFPDNRTNSGMPQRKRYFIAGNALVCGLVKTIGDEISLIIDKED